MDSVELKIILLRARKTQTEIARELGITPQAVNNAVSGRDKSRRVIEYIMNLQKELEKSNKAA